MSSEKATQPFSKEYASYARLQFLQLPLLALRFLCVQEFDILEALGGLPNVISSYSFDRSPDSPASFRLVMELMDVGCPVSVSCEQRLSGSLQLCGID